MRRLTRAPWVRSLAAAATAGYLRLAFRLMRWRREGLENLPEGPTIFAFWHGRLLMMAPAAAALERRTFVLISRSRDGAAIAAVAERFGLGVVHGSSRNRVTGEDKGGSAAARGLLDILQQGASAAITPDGPRGPTEQAQGGAAALSALSGAPVTAAAWSCRPAIRLKSWDGLLLPLPFARAALVAAPPLAAPESSERAALEAHRLKIEALLREATDRADLLAGRPEPLGPAPARRPRS